MATLNLILIFIAQGINGSAEVYYTKIVLGNSSLVGTFSVALQATQIICMFFIAGFVKKFGKRNDPDDRCCCYDRWLRNYGTCI